MTWGECVRILRYLYGYLATVQQTAQLICTCTGRQIARKSCSARSNTIETCSDISLWHVTSPRCSPARNTWCHTHRCLGKNAHSDDRKCPGNRSTDSPTHTVTNQCFVEWEKRSQETFPNRTQCTRASIAVADVWLSVCHVDVLCQTTESIIMRPSPDRSPATLVFPYQI